MVSIVSVRKRKGEDFNRLLARFRKLVKKSDHISELKNRREYLKPSVIKRKAKLAVIRENELAVRKEKLEEGNNNIKLYSNKRKKKSDGKTKQQRKETRIG